MTFEELGNISQEAFKELVKKCVRKSALNYLKQLQQTHNKAKYLTYYDLNLQSYLESGTSKMTIKEKCFAFAARSRTIDVRCNKLWGEKNLQCRLGCDENETQTHLLQCRALVNNDIVKDDWRGKHLNTLAWLVRPSAVSFTTNTAVELHSLRRIPPL